MGRALFWCEQLKKNIWILAELLCEPFGTEGPGSGVSTAAVVAWSVAPLGLASPELWIALVGEVGHTSLLFPVESASGTPRASEGLLWLLPFVKVPSTSPPLPFPPQHVQNKTHTMTSPSMHILDLKKLSRISDS